MQLAARFANATQSDIRRMSRECERVSGINLGQGICDLPTIPEVSRGAIDAIRDSRSTYTRLEGIDLLRQRIAQKMAAYNGIDADPETEIVVTAGATGGFACATLATMDPGTSAIVFEPYYGYHVHTLRLFGIDPISVQLRAPDWSLDREALERAFRPDTRAVVVCTPSNPAGKIFTREELIMIGEVCRERGAWMITDEIYEYIVFDGRKHVSPASIPECRDLTITISGFSKTFSITGWRIGYVHAPARVTRGIGLANDLMYVCAPTPLQWGVAHGLEVGREYYESLARDYQQKRDMLVGAVRATGMKPLVPEGAYYLLADVSELGFADSVAAADALLEQALVASVPGRSFFTQGAGDQILRFCFAKDVDVLEEACRRIESWGGG